MDKGAAASREAFALTASLMLTAMLLAVGLLSAACVTLEQGRSRRDLARVQARLHARAALAIALGELQSAVGPDRRATAEAALLAEEEPGRTHPHWVGVWRSDRLAGEAPGAAPFVHRSESGALRDRRFSGGSNYDARREVQRWLVSGGEFESASRADMLEVVGAGEADSPVFAPAVPSGSGVRVAWWASDEGVKARYNLPKPPPPADTLEAPCRLAPPPTVGVAALPGFSAAEEGVSPTMTDGDAELVCAADAAARRRHFHDLTPFSAGVLANQREGGLRRDLTAFLTSDGEASAGEGLPPVRAETPLLDGAGSPFALFGPRLGMLRGWALLGARADAGSVSPAIGERQVRASRPIPADAFHDGTHANLPDTTAWRSPMVAPVLTDAAVHHRLGFDSARTRPDGAPWLRLHLYPRVTLWNPYEVKLAAARYLVHLRVGGSPEFRLVKCNRRVTGRITGWRVYRDDEVNYATTQGSLLFVLDCPSMAPGASLLFLPARTRVFDLRNPGLNTLVPASTQGNAHFFLEDADAFEAGGLRGLAGVDPRGESWRLENSAAEDHAAALKLVTGAGAPDWFSARLYPTLRYISCSHRCGVGTTADPAWPASFSQPLLDTFDAPPAPMTRDGVRLRRVEETEGNLAAFAPRAHMNSAVLGDHNPLAPFACRHPMDNATPQEPGGRGVRRPEYFGIFTRDAFDAAAEWSSGRVVCSPLVRDGAAPALDSVVACPLPPAPARLTALADFGCAPMSPWAWQPMRVAGESRCAPYAPADASAYGAREEAWSGMGVGAKHYADWTRFGESSGEPLVYDSRFEVNHALFDGWCLLSGDAERRRAFCAGFGREVLPNARLVPAPGVSDAAERLTGKSALARGASAVLTAGAFNINSVSVDAWRAVLSSSLDAREGAPAGAVVYPRGPRVPAEGVGADAPWRTSDYWTRSRRLSATEVERLATEMVAEVRRRGPFLSLSDFVNRRLVGGRVSADPHAPSVNACGALQAAIDRAAVNVVEPGTVISRYSALPGTRHLPEQAAWVSTEGAAARLSQGDVLRALGPVMAARSDSFRVRVVAEAACGDGGSTRVALEAFVQRTPAPVCADPRRADEPAPGAAGRFGRRLAVLGVREVR